MLYFLGSPSGITIEEFVDLGNNEHFSKLTCSVLPTVDYWKNMNNQISTNIIAEDYNICFEYPVKSIKKAKASYTDVMLISKNTSIAVESKWTEDVGFYCKDQKSERRDLVQRHWINMISSYIGKELKLQQFEDIEYQLLHRVASACSLNKENCIVVYQIFHNDKQRDCFINEIHKLISVLGNTRIKFYIDTVKIDFTDEYNNLYFIIKDMTKKERAEIIKETIKRDNLFVFSNESLIQL